MLAVMTNDIKEKGLHSFSRLVVGTAGLAGLWGEVNTTESIDTILLALDSGVKAFDTAPAYNKAEEILGNALQRWNGEHPFISTKCGRLKSDNAFENRYDFSPEGIRRSVHESLETLHIEKLDVLFLHDPSLLKEEEAEPAIEAMVRLKEEGVVKQLGIGGNPNETFNRFITSTLFNVFMGYNRFNAVCQDAAINEFTLMQNQKISIWQASPLYNGLLGRHFESYQQTQPNWIPALHLLKAQNLFDYCKKVDCTMPELALRYVQGNPQIDKVVIGAVNQQEFTNSLNFWSKGSLNSDHLDIIHHLH